MVWWRCSDLRRLEGGEVFSYCIQAGLGSRALTLSLDSGTLQREISSSPIMFYRKQRQGGWWSKDRYHTRTPCVYLIFLCVRRHAIDPSGYCALLGIYAHGALYPK
jgi:hypothetical protein